MWIFLFTINNFIIFVENPTSIIWKEENIAYERKYYNISIVLNSYRKWDPIFYQENGPKVDFLKMSSSMSVVWDRVPKALKLLSMHLWRCTHAITLWCYFHISYQHQHYHRSCFCICVSLWSSYYLWINRQQTITLWWYSLSTCNMFVCQDVMFICVGWMSLSYG